MCIRSAAFSSNASKAAREVMDARMSAIPFSSPARSAPSLIAVLTAASRAA